MKNKLSTIFFLAISTMAFGQNFPLSGGYWHDAFIGFVGVPLSQYYYQCGDTTINDIAYKQLYHASSDLDGNLSAGSYYTAIRTSGEQVYALSNTDEILLYDFSLEAGDSILLQLYFGGEQELVVEETFIQDIEGDIRKFIVFESLGNFQEVWIEGIGSNRGLLDRGVHLFDDYYPFGVCFQHDDIYYDWSPPGPYYSLDCNLAEVIPEFSCPDIVDAVSKPGVEIAVRLSPNPVVDMLHVVFDDEIGGTYRLAVFSVGGKQVLEEQLTFASNFIEVQHLPKGSYVVSVFNNKRNAIFAGKIIIGN